MGVSTTHPILSMFNIDTRYVSAAGVLSDARQPEVEIFIPLPDNVTALSYIIA